MFFTSLCFRDVSRPEQSVVELHNYSSEQPSGFFTSAKMAVDDLSASNLVNNSLFAAISTDSGHSCRGLVELSQKYDSSEIHIYVNL